jgi:hypothetical protein
LPRNQFILITMKTGLFVFLLIAFLNASAQRNGISLEPIIGYGSGNNFDFNDQSKDAAKIGCGIVHMFNDHFGISSGLQYSSITSTYGDNSTNMSLNSSSNYSNYNGSIQWTFNYLEVPLLFRYISSKDNKIGFFAEAGFNFGFLIGSSMSGTITQTYNDFTSFPFTTTSSVDMVNGNVPGTSAFNISGHLAFGIFIPLSRKCSLIIDGEINYGLTSVGNGNSDIIYFNGVPYYYYNYNNQNPYNNSWSPNSNYGTDFSALACVRLNIKLEGSSAKAQTPAPQAK